MADMRPFELGALAHKNGEPISANPYDPKEQTVSHIAWKAGWNTQADVETKAEL